jgi:hypothetical protein
MARQDNSATETLREIAARARGTTGERRGIALFAGPDRAAMSAAADALAKDAGATLYRVDLNRIVSKYIGETEKNRLFVDSHAGIWRANSSIGDSLNRRFSDEMARGSEPLPCQRGR